MAKATQEEKAPRGANDPDFQKKVVELRDEQEMKWEEVAAELECTAGKAMLAYMIATIKPKDQLKWGKDEEKLVELIVHARDVDELSWGFIAAACRPVVPESRVRKLYTENTGNQTLGMRIGKGGRYPGDERPDGSTSTPRKAAAKKAPAKKAAAKKVAATKKAAPAKKAAATKKAANGPAKAAKAIKDMDFEEIKDRLDGKTISVQQGEKRVKIAVKSVLKLENGELSFADKSSKNRTVLVEDIKGATK